LVMAEDIYYADKSSTKDDCRPRSIHDAGCYHGSKCRLVKRNLPTTRLYPPSRCAGPALLH
jgi:hypothetical protein